MGASGDETEDRASTIDTLYITTEDIKPMSRAKMAC